MDLESGNPEGEMDVDKSSGDMDLEPGNPVGNQGAKREGDSVKNGSGTEVEDKDTNKRGKETEDSGEPLAKRILRSVSNFSLAPLPTVVEIKKAKGNPEIISSEDNTPVGKELIVHEELLKTEKHFSSLETSTMEESMQGRKNPMLLTLVISRIFEFLDLKSVKNCRLLSREWGSVGKQVLTTRAKIVFENEIPRRLPIYFFSCFLDFAPRFSSFEFSGDVWAMEELSMFFEKHQEHIKELTFAFIELPNYKNFDLSPWISKSPMVKSDVKYLTKLSSYGAEFVIPLHLLKHIKDLSLAHCRINVEEGIKIHPVKLSLTFIDFYQDEILLPNIKINDIVNFSSAEEIDLKGQLSRTQIIIIDLSGNWKLKSLKLERIDIVNWETSKWDIQNLQMSKVVSPAITQMTIRELHLSYLNTEDFDLFALPRSLEKLEIGEEADARCSLPITFEKLKYLSVIAETEPHFSVLPHFINCPQLTHLEFTSEYGEEEIKLSTIPETVKTLTLDNCSIDWAYGSCSYENIRKIVFFGTEINFEQISEAKISVDDIIIIWNKQEPSRGVRSVSNFFKYPNSFSFCKRFFIGEFKWDKIQLDNGVLNEQVDFDLKSPFYVFENGEKGRALGETSFYQLADISKRIEDV